MSYVLTLVAANPADTPVAPRHFKDVEEIIGAQDIRRTSAEIWLAPHKAVDLGISARPGGHTMEMLREALHLSRIDIFISPIERRAKKLLLADMDSTIVEGETLDDLAEFASIKDKISEITERAMRGELDFHSALRERVGLLRGLPAKALEKTLAKTKLNPGATELVSTMKKHGARCILVSGGFTFFTEAISKEAGFHFHHGNVLEIKNDALTGKVKDPILDKQAKVDYLNQYLTGLSLTTDDAMTIGDGANDIPMLKKAGFGVGYHPKPLVEKAVDNIIRHGDLTAALYAQGYTASDIAP